MARTLLLAWLALPAAGLVAAGPAADPSADDDDVFTMAPFNVTVSRLEDFGMQVRRGVPDPARSSLLWPVRTPVITAVLPNTAAARAGLKPGERILRADGKSTAATIFSPNKWRQLQTKKTDVVAAASKPVTWTLELESADGKTTRTVKLTVPTPPPHWGESPWVTPAGRTPAAVAEPGPLAARAGLVMNNGIWSLFTNTTIAQDLGWVVDATHPLLGYQWTITEPGNRRHRIFVTQQRGRTEIILEIWAGPAGWSDFLTSPSGALEKATHRSFGPSGQSPAAEESRARFQKEMDFWLNEVTEKSARWPMELEKGTTVGITTPGQNGGGPPRPPANATAPVQTPAPGPRAVQFLKLPAATAEQRALFTEAFAKIGADEENWAYTETARGLDDKHQTVVRIDPSKPEAERATLLKYDGKPPTPAQVKTWRDQGRDTPATLGDLPPLGSVIDFTDLRVSANETAAVVFELPIVGGNAAFPADKFQALFRVNKARRSLEDITVRMREDIKVVGMIKITDVGLEAHFQTFDPAYPPQPVALKAGGAAKLLFVKISRSFEASRTDYVRVVRHEEAPVTAPAP